MKVIVRIKVRILTLFFFAFLLSFQHICGFTHTFFLFPFLDGVLNKTFEISLCKGLLQSAAEMNAETLVICSQALNCTSQLFAWMSMNQYCQITNSLLGAIFVFASFGCCSVRRNGDNGEKANVSQLGNLAMNCINEIMAKNCVLGDATEFLHNIFRNVFKLLQKLTSNDDFNELFGSESINEEYMGKLTEFLRLFVAGHIQRFENLPTFSVIDFLSLLFKYTFKQATAEQFLDALEVWSIFIDYILLKYKQLQEYNKSLESKGVEYLQKYKEALTSVLANVVRKIQFRFNASCLEQLSDEILEDEEGDNEAQTYFKQCLDIVAKIAEIFPSETFDVIKELHEDNINIYLGASAYVQKDVDGLPVAFKFLSDTDFQSTHYVLRDLSTALKVSGRLADQFITEHFSSRFIAAKYLIDSLVRSLVFANQLKIHTIRVNSEPLLSLQNDLIDIHAQIIATIKAYCHWISQYYNQTASIDQNNDCFILLNTITEKCVEIISCDINYGDNSRYPEPVVHSAIHCLYSISTTIRPSFLLNMNCIQELYNAICLSPCNSATQLTQQNKCLQLNISSNDEKLLCRCISSMLLLPWPNIPDASQNWSIRSMHHDKFIAAISEPLKNVVKEKEILTDQTVLQEKNTKMTLHITLDLLNDIISIHKDSPTRSKQLLFNSIKEPLEILTALMPIYLPHPDIAEDCLQFFIVSFDVFRAQIGLGFVEQIIRGMLSLFQQNNLPGFAFSEGNVGGKVIAKFFKMLTFVVQHHGNAFKTLLPGMISFTLDQICPVIFHITSPDFRLPFYEFLYHTLLNNWKYFFPNNSVLMYVNGSSENKEVIEHEEDFVRIMQVFGQSFLQTDITLFKFNMEALEKLNSRLKLFHKEAFRRTVLKEFLSLFFSLLLNKGLTILQDEIIAICYNMAAVDFDYFFHNFLPQFLNSCETLDENQKRVLLTQSFKSNEYDCPSFSLNLTKFICDLRFYNLCNNSLIQGSKLVS